MSGAINFMMADVYGVGYSTTEETVPEAADQKAIVDDQKTAAVAENTTKAKPFPILAALVLIFILALVVGGLK